MSVALAFQNQPTKQCTVCKCFLPLQDFAMNRANKKDGRQYACKPCDRNRLKTNRLARIEDVRRKGNEYRRKKLQNFDFRIQQLVNASKQRALSKNRVHAITKEDVMAIYPPDGKCPVFGFVMTFGDAGFRECSPSIDRIDSSKGYTKDNIQVMSWKANRIKGSTSVEDLELLIMFLKSGG